MLDDRKLAVLRAVVEDYVATRDPVGSKALVERHGLDVSPATIRNDMAVLEEDGYITAPHTSAGRIPTDKGYRLFVDRLSEIKPLSPAERRAIDRFMDGALDLDDLVRRTVRLLAQLTRQVAVVQYPSLTRSTVQHVELVSIAPGRMLLVLITSAGRVEQRVVDVPEGLSEELVGRLREALNAAVVGKRLTDATSTVEVVEDAFPDEHRPMVDAVVATLIETLVARSEERLAVAGTANLSVFAQDFPTAVAPVLEALEEHVVLLRLLEEATSPLATGALATGALATGARTTGARTTGALTVRIGAENPRGLSGTSVVATGYGPDDRPIARLGVVGPTRMDYPGAMGAVAAIARYLSRIIDSS